MFVDCNAKELMINDRVVICDRVSSRVVTMRAERVGEIKAYTAFRRSMK